MFSRNFPFLISLLVLLISLASCTPKIGEEPPESKMPELGATKCLSHSAEVLQKFVANEATSEELRQGWDCIYTAFVLFQKYIRGSESDRYTPAELAQFFEKNFFEKKPDGDVSHITPSLQIELMKFKQLFVGGSRETIARDELPRILNFITTIKGLSLQLNPYMVVVTKKWKPAKPEISVAEQDFFEQANDTIQQVSRKIGELIQDNHQTYAFIDFVNFLTELSGFYNEKWAFVDQLKTYLPVIEKLKVAVSGGLESEVGPREWPSFLLLGARGYIQYLRYFYFIESVPKDSIFYAQYVARTVEDTLSVFQDLVNLKPSQLITKAETRGICIALSEAWPTFKTSDRLIDDAMKIKQIFFGGSRDNWTVGDFNTARLKINKLRDLTKTVLPYFSVYSTQWQPTVGDDEENQAHFAEAEKRFVSTATELGRYLESSYSVDDLLSLVEELENMYPDIFNRFFPDGEPKPKLSEVLKKYKTIFLDVKGVIFTDSSPVISKGIWSPFLQFSSQGYASYLYAHYFLVPFEIKSSVGAASMGQISEKAANIIDGILKQRKEVGISYIEISHLLADLKDLKIIPEQLQLSTLEGVVKALTENFLVAPEERLAHQIPTSFNRISLNRLRYEVRTWIQPEIFLGQIFENPATQVPTQAQLIELVDRKRVEAGISYELKQGLEELSLALHSPIPMTTDLKGRLQITNRLEHLYNRDSVLYLNLSQTAARLLTQSYIQDLVRLRNHEGINKCEATNAFSALKAPFIDLNLLDVKSTFVNSRFLEANIFVPRANGDVQVDFGEFTDLISMILSGVKNDSLLKEQLRTQCKIVTDPATKKESATFGCIRTVYLKALPVSMTGTPDYLTYMTNTKEKIWIVAFSNLLKAAGWVPQNVDDAIPEEGPEAAPSSPYDSQMVHLSDLSLLPHIVQYLEMVIAKFDSNKDGIIASDEAVRAFPLFKALIRDLAAPYIEQGLVKESDLLAVFTFILRYGKAPSKEVGLTWLIWKGKKPEKWDVAADRTQLSLVLGYIADQVAAKPKPIQSENDSHSFAADICTTSMN